MKTRFPLCADRASRPQTHRHVCHSDFFSPPCPPKARPSSLHRTTHHRTNEQTDFCECSKKRKKVSLFQQCVDVNPPPSSFPSLSLTFWSVLKLLFFHFPEIFPDMQALKRFPPRAGGGPMRRLIPLSVFLMHSTQAAGPETPITSKCLVGGKYFHGASNSHLVCRRFQTHWLGSARLSMELNEGATRSQA